MKNTIGSGDYTGAFVNAIAASYDIAFVQPRVVRIQRATQEAQYAIQRATQDTQNRIDRATAQSVRATEYAYTHPTAVPKTPAQIKAEREALKMGIATFILICLLLACIWGLVMVAIMVWERAVLMYRMVRQISLVSGRIGDILVRVFGLLDEEEGDKLYQLWLSIGGATQPQDGQVSADLAHARAGTAEALEAWNELSKRFLPMRKLPWWSFEGLHNVLTKFETVYITLTGRTPEVMSMTGLEQYDLINPLTVVADADPVLVMQIRAVMADRDPDSLRITLMVVDPSKLNELGVLGYLLRIKTAIAQLDAARTAVPTQLEDLTHRRDEYAAGLQPIEDFLPVASQMAFINVQLEQAATLASGNRWTEALVVLRAVGTALVSASEALEAIRAVVVNVKQRMDEVDELNRQGYDLTRYDRIRHECVGDMDAIRRSFEAGEWGKVGEAVDELERDSKRLVEKCQAVVALHSRNEADLIRLSQGVAEVSALRAQVEQAWMRLQSYPQSNWGDVADNFGIATAILFELFDTPDDASDIASRIGSMNNMDNQKFSDAEKALVEAFDRLHRAQQLIQQLAAREQLVTGIEAGIHQTISDARADVTRATNRRDADPTFIDQVVDQQLVEASELIEQAEFGAEHRRFLQANEQISKARELANAAHTAADQQASAIRNLYAELSLARQAATDIVRQVVSQIEQYALAARTQTGRDLIVRAQAALSVAQRAETAVSGEDHVLAQNLEGAISLYRQALGVGREAVRQVEADEREYRERLAAAVQVIAEADDAITNAATAVGHTDAHNAGSDALAKARRLNPNAPAYGSTDEDIRKVVANARAAKEAAEQAQAAANARIQEEEAERKAEERRQQELRDAALAATRISHTTYHHSTPSSSFHSSSYGSMGGRSSSIGSMGGRSSSYGGMGRF